MTDLEYIIIKTWIHSETAVQKRRLMYPAISLAIVGFTIIAFGIITIGPGAYKEQFILAIGLWILLMSAMLSLGALQGFNFQKKKKLLDTLYNENASIEEAIERIKTMDED
jgi:hypothetical protein